MNYIIEAIINVTDSAVLYCILLTNLNSIEVIH